MYMHTSFRGAKTCKIGEKKVYLYGHVHKFVKGHVEKIKKKACKNVYLRSIFILGNTCVGCVLKVLL